MVLHTEKLRGAIGRPITVQTNDSARPTVLLTVRANVLASVEIYPFEYVHITNRGPSKEKMTLLIKKDATETGALAIANPKSSVAWLAVSAQPLTAERPGSTGMPTGKPGDWLVEVALDGHADYGHQSAEVEFDTGLAREPHVKLPVVAELLPPLTLSSERIEIPWPASGDGASATVLVRLRQGLDAGGLQVRSESPELAVELAGAGPRAFKLVARWTGQTPPHGSVVLKIGDESMSIPVTSTGAAS